MAPKQGSPAPNLRLGRAAALLLLGLCALPAACKRQVAAVQPTANPAAQPEAQRAARRAPQPAVAGSAKVGDAPDARVERPARLAGSWYLADPPALRAELQANLAAAKADASAKSAKEATSLLGVIAPHAGYRFSGPVAAHAYRQVAAAQPKRVFVLGPSHHKALRGVAVVHATHFATPLGDLKVDVAAGAQLLRNPLFFRDDEADAREHSVEMQMPYLRLVAPDAAVVPLIVGALTLPEVQQVAAQLRAALRPGDLVVASSDFTHHGPRFGYTPFQVDVPKALRDLDMRAADHIASADLPAFWRFKHGTGATICGFYPVSVLVALFGAASHTRLLKYDTSGRITGDFDNSVSYLAMALEARSSAAAQAGTTGHAPFLSLSDQERALQIARRTLESHFDPSKPALDPVAAGLVADGRLAEVHGVFVTLKQRADDSLRGCIGNIVGREPLHKGIVRHALNAALHDPRFDPVRAEELPNLVLEVTVLTPPREVAGPDEITIGLHGVILQRDGRSAVFLPQVAVEQGWGLERTLSALARKAGLPSDGWRTASFQVFQGHVYDERHLESH